MGKRGLIMFLSIAAIIGAIVYKIIQTKQQKEAENSPSIKNCFVFNNGSKSITGYYYNLCGSDVIIPAEINGNKVEVIDENAFQRMNLTSVTLPDTLLYINQKAFDNNKIESVVIPESVKSIGPSAFSNNKIKNLEIKGSKVEIGEAAFNNNELPDKDAFIYSRSNGLDKKYIVSYGGSNKKITIPKGTINIGTYAFSDVGLESVTFNNELEILGNGAFTNNSLKTVALPRSIIYLGDNVFDYDIEKITVNGKNSIDDFDFYGQQAYDNKVLSFTGGSKKDDKDKKEE